MEKKTNYDKLFDVLIEWYNEKQIEEIWELLKKYDTNKDLNSKINVYAYWLLQLCDDPVGEIEWLVNLALNDSPNSKKQMLDVLEIHKNHENN